MPYSITAPRDFFDSPEIPHICVVYGGTENISLHPSLISKPTKYRYIDESDVPLSFSPEGWEYWQSAHDREPEPERFFIIYLFALIASAIAGLIQWLILPDLDMTCFPLATAVLILFGSIIHRGINPTQYPRPPWGKVQIEELIRLGRPPLYRISFPRRAQPLFRAYATAFNAWSARTNYTILPAANDEWTEGVDGAWDEAKPKG